MAEKPFAPACERNREPILTELATLLRDRANTDQTLDVLEIGSGTGQHAVFFSRKLASFNIRWQPSELAEHLPGIELWRAEANLPNLLAPIALDLAAPQWQHEAYDWVFTANTLHIVSWSLVQQLIKGAAITLKPGGQLIIYGPFNYGGEYTSESNHSFDRWLKDRDAHSGIRDFEAVAAFAGAQAPALECVRDVAMPANNRLLVFVKGLKGC